MGLKSFATKFGYDQQSIVNSDAGVAFATTQRQHFVKFRHNKTQWLWTQEQMKKQDFDLQTNHGKWNPTNLMPKHLPTKEINKFFEMTNCEIRKDKSEKPLAVANVGKHGSNNLVGTPNANRNLVISGPGRQYVAGAERKLDDAPTNENTGANV